MAHLGLTLSISGVTQIGISSHWINTILFQEEMKWEERGIFTRLYFIVLCLDSQNWKYYKLIGFNMENWFVNLGSWFIIGVFQLHYKILWYLWSMHAQDQIFLCHLKFTLWVSQTSTPEDVFSFYVLFTHFRSCDNIIFLENWCFFRLSSHLHAYLYACMYCTHNLQTVKLEILLRLEIGKQNMQAQDFYCRNHFGHHGR